MAIGVLAILEFGFIRINYDMLGIFLFGYFVIERIYAYFKMKEYDYLYRIFLIYLGMFWYIFLW